MWSKTYFRSVTYLIGVLLGEVDVVVTARIARQIPIVPRGTEQARNEILW